MEIITRKRTVWLTFLDVLYKKKLPLQSIHAKGVPFFVTPLPLLFILADSQLYIFCYLNYF